MLCGNHRIARWASDPAGAVRRPVNVVVSGPSPPQAPSISAASAVAEVRVWIVRFVVIVVSFGARISPFSPGMTARRARSGTLDPHVDAE